MFVELYIVCVCACMRACTRVCVCVNIIVEIGECAINFTGKNVIPKFIDTASWNMESIDITLV